MGGGDHFGLRWPLTRSGTRAASPRPHARHEPKPKPISRLGTLRSHPPTSDLPNYLPIYLSIGETIGTTIGATIGTTTGQPSRQPRDSRAGRAWHRELAQPSPQRHAVAVSMLAALCRAK